MKARSQGALALISSLVMIIAMISVPSVLHNATAQSKGTIPIKDALVVVIETGSPAAANMVSMGGSPYQLKRMINSTGGLFLIQTKIPNATTDAEGKFNFNVSLKPGSYDVTANAPGYILSRSDVAGHIVVNDNGTTSLASANRDDSNNNLVLSMQPSAVITGRIVDEFENPIPGIIVTIGSPFNAANYDVTMDDGIFVLDTNLGTGTYTINAFKPDAGLASLSSLVSSTETNRSSSTSSIVPVDVDAILSFGSLWKIPSYSDNSSAGWVSATSNVTLTQGKLTTMDMQLRHSYSIYGKVVDAAGRPLSGLPVLAFSKEGRLANAVDITDAEGNYILDNDLQPGAYKVIVPFPFSKDYVPSGSIVVIPKGQGNSSDISADDIALSISETISGRVVDKNGNGVSNAIVSSIPKTASATDNMMDVSGDYGRLENFLDSGITVSMTDSNGNYVLNGTIGKSKDYTIMASFGDIAPVRSSIEANTGDHEGSNATTAVSDIVLDFTGLVHISGKVVDIANNPVKGAQIRPLIVNGEGLPPLSDATGYSYVTTKPDGTFAMDVPFEGDVDTVYSLLSSVTISAEGYKDTKISMASNGGFRDDFSVLLERIPPIKITGMVVSQEDTQPVFIENVLTRKGTINLEHSGNPYKIGIETNSKILDAAFDQPDKRITLRTEGISNSEGTYKIAIPKEILDGLLGIMIDGQMISPNFYKISENQTHLVIDIRYPHSHQDIVIQGTATVPEFALPVSLTAISISFAILLAAIANRAKLNFRKD